MFFVVSIGVFLIIVCFVYLVFGVFMGVLVYEFGVDMLLLWFVGLVLCY